MDGKHKTRMKSTVYPCSFTHTYHVPIHCNINDDDASRRLDEICMLWCSSYWSHQHLHHGMLPIITSNYFLPVYSSLHSCCPSPLSPIPYLPIFQKIPVAHHKIFQCYGAWAEDGYGVAYIPQDDRILFGISSCRHAQHPDTSTKQYIQKLRESMTEMHDIMVATGGHTSKLWF